MAAIGAGATAAVSPSTRRVWIEISTGAIAITDDNSHPPHGGCGLKSELLREIKKEYHGHPPHGGCGLKLQMSYRDCLCTAVTLHTEGVD